MKRVYSILVFTAVTLALAACGNDRSAHTGHDSDGAHTASAVTLASDSPNTKYRCPMHPEFIRDDPGSCGICGMNLVAFDVSPDAAQSSVSGRAVVTMNDAQRQRIGVRTTTVRRANVTRTMVTTGRVVPDERRVTHIHTKFDGWIERLYVDFTGQHVRAGDPVFDVYSPELVAAQQEYLVARQSSAQELTRVAQQRLRLLDMTEAQIRHIEESGEPMTRFTVHAPSSGTVIAKNAVSGHRISAATTLYTITDLSHVWVLADAYESDAPFLSEGVEAHVSSPGNVAESFSGRVTFISPVVNLTSRTVPVRVEVANPSSLLRLGSFVDVTFEVPLGERIVVHRGSVLESGRRAIVFVESERGRYEPREVTTGVRTAELVEIRHGLEPGEIIVSSATFFVDSESQLQSIMTFSTDDASAGHSH